MFLIYYLNLFNFRIDNVINKVLFPPILYFTLKKDAVYWRVNRNIYFYLIFFFIFFFIFFIFFLNFFFFQKKGALLKQFHLLNEGIQNEESSFSTLQTIKFGLLKFGEKIGSGATSDVYKGIIKYTKN